MKCQYCHENEAENTFMVQFPGGMQEIHLCARCTEGAKRYVEMAHQSHPESFPAWGAGTPDRKVGDSPFPDDAGEDIRQRRRLNALRARLTDAVANEQYETAARLRDQISEVEKDVFAL